MGDYVMVLSFWEYYERSGWMGMHGWAYIICQLSCVVCKRWHQRSCVSCL